MIYSTNIFKPHHPPRFDISKSNIACKSISINGVENLVLAPRKSYFVYFNSLFYNSSYIITLIFHNTSKHYLFIYYSLLFSLFNLEPPNPWPLFFSLSIFFFSLSSTHSHHGTTTTTTKHNPQPKSDPIKHN